MLFRMNRPFPHHFLSLLMIGVTLLVGENSAQARPEYARREAKACSYCHISSSPGYLDPTTNQRESITRNKRGLYYQTHNHSFDGYKEIIVMGKDAPPNFHFAWKADFTDLPRRAAVGNVAGDAQARLIMLNEKPGQPQASVVMVRRWDGKAFINEFTGEAKSAPDRLAVGKFAGAQKPAVIITADALWYWNGKTYARKPAARPLAIIGSTRLKDGTERVLIANSPNDVKAYRVQIEGTGDWLVDPINAPASSQVIWGDMHGTPDYFEQMGMPTVLGAGGIVGLWDARQFGTMFLYYVRIDQDLDAKANPDAPNKTEFVAKNRASFVVFRNPKDQLAPELWFSPRMNGVVSDIATENPQGDGKPGLLILTSDSASGKARSLYFFALD